MVTVRVEVFEVASVIFIEAGLKLAPAPAGNPVAPRFTTPVKPASGVMVTKYIALSPGTSERAEGVALIAKSGVAEAGAEATKVE